MVDVPLRSRNWFGKKDLDGFAHRSWVKAEGFSEAMFDGRPVIGIANSWSELTSCNAHLRQVAEAVKRGVLSAGGFHVIYGTENGLSADFNQFWTQDSAGVPGVAAQGDIFGETLAVGNFNGDAYDDLAVSAPSEDISGGTNQGVITVKPQGEPRAGYVADVERGFRAEISPIPWQTDTCIGQWHYNRRLFEQKRYLEAAAVIHRLCDIVSKNGNLLLSIPVRGDGSSATYAGW